MHAGRGCIGDFFLRLRTCFFRPYLDSRLRETTCSYETHASSLVLFSYMRSNTLTTIPCTTTHSYAQKSLGTWCLRHRAARLTSQVRLVLVQPGSRSSRVVRTMLVPSVSPAQGHMQVCVLVKAPGAVRGAESLHMYAGHLAGLAPGQNEHVRLEAAKLALCSTPARARFGMHRERDRTQGATRNTPQYCCRPGRSPSIYSYAAGFR